MEYYTVIVILFYSVQELIVYIILLNNKNMNYKTLKCCSTSWLLIK